MSNKQTKKPSKPGPKNPAAKAELSDDELGGVTGGAALPTGGVKIPIGQTPPYNPRPPKIPPIA